MRVMDCIGKRQLSVQDSIKADFGEAEVTLTLKAEESSERFGLCRIDGYAFTDSLFVRGKTNRQTEMKNSPLKRSLITSQSP